MHFRISLPLVTLICYIDIVGIDHSLTMEKFGKSSNPPSEKRFKVGEVETFPKSLEDFGYKFVDGKLRSISTGEPFKFEVRIDDHNFNQQHYEALGDVITNHVYDLLVSEGGLIKRYITCNSRHQTFIFHSENAFTRKKLLILIHGSGVVRAGQWARRLIINDCLNSGTQLPFIKRAQELGYGILVLNTNDHPGDKGPEKHAIQVWKELISNSEVKRIAIIAHSFGGYVTVQLCSHFFAECRSKIFAVAFTDSVHRFGRQNTPAGVVQWFQKVGRNWVVSDKDLDKPLAKKEGEVHCVSAGTTVHEMTSWSSFRSIFDFLEQRYAKMQESSDDDSDDDSNEDDNIG